MMCGSQPKRSISSGLILIQDQNDPDEDEGQDDEAEQPIFDVREIPAYAINLLWLNSHSGPR